MTNTTSPATDWDSYEFELIADQGDPDFGNLPIGHASATCPRIDGPVVAVRTSARLAGVDTPWPCSCVEVASFGRTVAFEAPRSLPTSGSGRSTADAEPVDPRQAEAIEFARTYSGSLSFMLAMKEKAARRSWTPTPNMLAAILRIKDEDAARPAAPAAAANVRPNRFAGSCGTCRKSVAAEAGRIEKVNGAWVVYHLDGACPAAPVASTSAPSAALADVPEGHYAIASTGANDLAFYRVDRPTEGKWAGRTFVKLVVGGHPDQPVKRDNVPGILDRIAAAGIEASARLYGQEIGRCCRCNRHLTDETSRQLGIGPECRSKAGW